jgi:hypothetical protein
MLIKRGLIMYGNINCEECGKSYSKHFKQCVYCCNHDKLGFDEDYHCGWHLTTFCLDCGNNLDISNDDVIKNYIAVKKPD